MIGSPRVHHRAHRLDQRAGPRAGGAGRAARHARHRRRADAPAAGARAAPGARRRDRRVLMSVVLRERATRLLPLAAAVAVCEALPLDAAIKWPNDVWVDGRKVAGILVEGRPQEGWAVLGIGLNVAHGATSRRSCARRPRRCALDGSPTTHRRGAVDALLARPRRWLGRRAGRASSPPGASATRCAASTVRWANGGKSGTAAGIDDGGALLVDTADGPRRAGGRRGAPGALGLGARSVRLSDDRTAGAPRAVRGVALVVRLARGVLLLARARPGRRRRARSLGRASPPRLRGLRARPSAPSASPPPFRRRRRPPRRRLPLGKFFSSSRARALGLRAIRIRAPSSTCWASGVCASAAASSAADSRRSCLRAACTSRRALRACAAPAELTSSPSSRFVSGQRCTAYSSCTSREYSARCQSQRAAWSRRPICFSVSAWSSTLTPSRRSSRDQPPTISTASSNASGSRRLPDLAERAQAQLRVAVAPQAGHEEQAAQLAGRVEVEHRLGAAPVVRGHARARQHRPGLLLAPAQVLHGDPPQLALEDLRAALRIGGDRHHAPLDAQPPAAPAPHRARPRSRRRGRRRDRAASAASRPGRRWASPGARSRRRSRPPCPASAASRGPTRCW